MSDVDDLLAFVRQQLAAKEQEARAFLGRTGMSLLAQRLYREQLAEVEAKRRVLDRYADAHWHAPAIPGATSPVLQVEETGACRTCVTMRLLAQPHAGQPGWREEWRA